MSSFLITTNPNIMISILLKTCHVSFFLIKTQDANSMKRRAADGKRLTHAMDENECVLYRNATAEACPFPPLPALA